jgi:hypothetical protein
LRLANIDIAAPRDNITFCVHPTVREDKRKWWKRTTLIQSIYRMLKCRRHFRFIKDTVIALQSYIPCVIAAKSYQVFCQHVIKSQSIGRRYSMARRYSQARTKVCYLQRSAWGHCERLRYQKVKAVLPLVQSACMILRAKRAMARRRDFRRRQWRAALTIQRNWYVWNNQFSTFLLLGCRKSRRTMKRRFRRFAHTRRANERLKLQCYI